MARRVRLATVGVRPPNAENRILETGSVLDLVLHHIRREVEAALAWRPDLLLLPEACDRPLDLAPADVGAWESGSAPAVRAMLAEIARANSLVVAYGAGRDALVVLERDGSVCATHRGAGARGAALVSCSAGTLGCVLTDDLQDEAVMSRYRELGPDLLLLASRFPGGMLEQYWAFTCRCHAASAVLFRSDLRLPCTIVSPVGAVLASSTTAQSHAREVVNLDCAVVHLDGNREKLLRLQAERGDGISISDPGYLGGVCVANESSSGTIGEVLERAGVATIDQYFDHYLAVREQSLARGRKGAP